MAMQIQELARYYETRTDEQLLGLAADLTQLTSEAQIALAGELAKRRITAASHPIVQDETHQPRLRQPETPRGIDSELQGVREFVAQVLRVYRRRFWLFIRLVAPAMLVGYLAMRMGREGGREILRHLIQGAVKYPVAVAEMWLANLTGYYVSWMGFLFSFGATCSAVQQIGAGGAPSARESFVQVHKRSGPLLRLGLLFFLLYLMVGIATALLFWGVVWLFTYFHARLSGLSFLAFSFGIKGLAVVVLSRFALAVPAVVLDDYKVGKAMFLSDELTEGKWQHLAALAAKSLIGGYLAAMIPFWLAGWLLDSTALPWLPWVLTTLSIAGVAVIAPPLFIGFAVLYQGTSKAVSMKGEALALQSR